VAFLSDGKYIQFFWMDQAKRTLKESKVMLLVGEGEDVLVCSLLLLNFFKKDFKVTVYSVHYWTVIRKN